MPGLLHKFYGRGSVYNQYDVRGVWPKDPNDGGGNDRSRSPSPRGRGRGVRAVA